MSHNHEFPASVRSILGWNIVLHGVSGIFTAIWVTNLVAPDGEMTFLNWLETLLAMAAVTIGLSYGSYLALRHVPFLAPARRRIAAAVVILGDTVLALVLAVAAASVLAGAAGENAHMEASRAKMTEATEIRRRAFSTIINRITVLNECEDTGAAMSIQEGATGAYSREGGDVGRVATTLANIAKACATARDAIYANRANLTRHFAKVDRLLIDIRRTIDSKLDRRAKLIAVRKQGDEFQKLIRAINDGLGVEEMSAVSDALRKDWNAAGLPSSGAAAITHNFTGLADLLVDGLDDIAALKNEPAPGVTSENATSYLYLYPKATLGAIAIGICIELLPLFGIILGFAILMRGLSEPDAGTSYSQRNVQPGADLPSPTSERKLRSILH